MNTLNIKEELNSIRPHKHNYINFHNSTLKTKELLKVLKAIYKIDNNATILVNTNLQYCTIEYNRFKARLKNFYLPLAYQHSHYDLIYSNIGIRTITILESNYHNNNNNFVYCLNHHITYTLYFKDDEVCLIGGYRHTSPEYTDIARIYRKFKLTSDSKIKDPFYIDNLTWHTLVQASNQLFRFTFKDDCLLDIGKEDVEFIPIIKKELELPYSQYQQSQLQKIATFTNKEELIANIQERTTSLSSITFHNNLVTLTNNCLIYKNRKEELSLPHTITTNLTNPINEFKIDFNINLLKQLVEPFNNVTNTNTCDLYKHKDKDTYIFKVNGLLFEIDKYCYKPINNTF